jgi:2-oxo-3-hexenedioate decarboxylase/2-keto-4-pentenoate hydratase
MDETQRRQAAALLAQAEVSREPIVPLSTTFPEIDVDDAYAIQEVNMASRLAAGRTVLGHKVGLTSRAMQEMLGVDQPDSGVLLDDMFYATGDEVPAGRFLQPRVEIEIAFELRTALRGPGVSAADVMAATAAVAPSIEIIDSRIADWKIALEDTIADNASSAAVVIGPWTAIGDAPDLLAVKAELFRNGDLVAEGCGGDVLGDPAEALAWLANRLGLLGGELKRGHVVMPGSCTRAIDVVAGDRIEAKFGGLGSVRVDFV